MQESIDALFRGRDEDGRRILRGVTLLGSSWPSAHDSFQQSELVIELGVTGRTDGFTSEKWQIRFADLRSWRLAGTGGRGRSSLFLHVGDEHVVLWPYRYPTNELYFHRAPSDIHGTVSRLLEAHYRTVEHWFDWTTFLRPGFNGSLAEKLRGGFGMLAEGPEPVIDAFIAVMRETDAAISSPPAESVNGEGGPQPLAITWENSFTWETSFVVAGDITAHRI